MSKLHFSTDIQAPRATVWNVLWNDATYREWTSVFSEGSYAVSDWNEGSKVQFLDATSGSGMSAVIQQKRPNEFMSFRHVAEESRTERNSRRPRGRARSRTTGSRTAAAAPPN